MLDIDENESDSPELEQTTDATDGDSSDASDGDGGQAAAAPAAKPEQQEPQTPFHEHPRFKELVEQKNQALAAQRSLEQKLAQIEQRFSQQQQQQPQTPSKEETERQALIEDLRKVDPRLAAQIEASYKAQSTVAQLQAKLEQFEQAQRQTQQQAQIQTAVSKINGLHEANKVSPEVRQFINDKMDLLYMQGKLNVQNIDSEYKTAFDGISKYVEQLKRAERESYVADKKKDAAVPTSQPKGQPAKPAPKKPQWSKDPEVARQQIVNRFLKQQAANKDADSV
jgi:DNA repair exonuclease SbcCD ATPase subunit